MGGALLFKGRTLGVSLGKGPPSSLANFTGWDGGGVC